MTGDTRPRLLPDAKVGLPWEVVERLSPYTEADEAGLLFSFLTCLGNACGPYPAIEMGNAPHPARLFTWLVGPSTDARKGTAIGIVRRLFKIVDPEWHQYRISRGIKNTPAFVNRIADDQPTPETHTSHEIPARNDHRLLVAEAEGTRLIATIAKYPDLGVQICGAYDGEVLDNDIKSAPQSVDGHMVSILAGITDAEMTAGIRVLTKTGLGNRNLYVWSQGTRPIGRGGNVPHKLLENLAPLVREAVDATSRAAGGPISERLFRYAGLEPPREEWLEWPDDAWDFWDNHLYVGSDVESEGDVHHVQGVMRYRPGGMAGEVTKRYAPQTARLAMAYLRAGAQPLVALKAGWACQKYAEASAERIFGGMRVQADQDMLLDALAKGDLSRTDIIHLFQNHRNQQEIDAVIGALMRVGLIRRYWRGQGVHKTEMFALIEKPSEVGAA